MKTTEQLLADVERRLSTTWAKHIASTCTPPQRGDQQESLPASWPHAFPLGEPSSADLAATFGAATVWAANWRSWSRTHGATLQTRSRLVHGTRQDLPTHLVIADIDHAAQICGPAWVQRLHRGRQRARALAEDFPHLVHEHLLASTLAAVDALNDVDFDLLRRAGAWFARHDATGLTPRQVPIEGLQAKWLNHRHALIRRLASRDHLGLLPPHPPRVHFTYLDPAHRAAGHRWHDSATIGDHMAPAYQPHIVVISENKDTAIYFPELEAAISVEGVGRGGKTIAALPWIIAADHIFYWGDMDADGLEILNEFRTAGIPATSLFMDMEAFTTWERYGTNLDPRGRPLQPRTPRPTPLLTEAEAELYHRLTAEEWKRHRRVEQERIPLAEAASLIQRTVQARA